MTAVPGPARSHLAAAVVATEARLRGASVGVVGPTPRRDVLLAQIGQALRFPGYYGRNLDALEECLTDLSWLPEGEVVLVWDGDDELRRPDPAGYAVLLEVLADVAERSTRSAHPLRVVLPAPE